MVKYGQTRSSTGIHGVNVYQSYHDFEYPFYVIRCICHCFITITLVLKVKSSQFYVANRGVVALFKRRTTTHSDIFIRRRRIQIVSVN